MSTVRSTSWTSGEESPRSQPRTSKWSSSPSRWGSSWFISCPDLCSPSVLHAQVMQFGRIESNAYTLDFQYPFSTIQAFAVALANVTQRLKWFPFQVKIHWQYWYPSLAFMFNGPAFFILHGISCSIPFLAEILAKLIQVTCHCITQKQHCCLSWGNWLLLFSALRTLRERIILNFPPCYLRVPYFLSDSFAIFIWYDCVLILWNEKWKTSSSVFMAWYTLHTFDKQSIPLENPWLAYAVFCHLGYWNIKPSAWMIPNAAWLTPVLHLSVLWFRYNHRIWCFCILDLSVVMSSSSLFTMQACKDTWFISVLSSGWILYVYVQQFCSPCSHLLEAYSCLQWKLSVKKMHLKICLSICMFHGECMFVAHLVMFVVNS